jgi:hypothetical protein
MSIVWSVLGILLCGGVAGGVAWLLVRALALDGVPAALVALVVGMVLAVACWIGLTTLLRVMKVLQ